MRAFFEYRIRAPAAIRGFAARWAGAEMELHVEAADGQAPPKDAFVSIKVGAAYKQTRFAGARSFRFPDASVKHCDIEVFQRIGGASFTLAGAVYSELLVDVPCQLPDLQCIQIGVSSNFTAQRRGIEEERGQQGAVGMDATPLVAALREAIRARPDDPWELIRAAQMAQDGQSTSPVSRLSLGASLREIRSRLDRRGRRHGPEARRLCRANFGSPPTCWWMSKAVQGPLG